MTATVDLTDVPAIAERDLALALRLMLSGGRVLAAADDFSEDDIRRVEQAFWARKSATQLSKVAVLLRLRSLLTVFSNRRMRELLDQYGSAAVPHALLIASRMRLNTRWGFNPQKFARALREALSSPSELPAAA